MTQGSEQTGAAHMGDLVNSMPSWMEEAWMQRYLDRDLTQEESNWFEAYCLDREHLMAAIEVDTQLRDLMARHGGVLAVPVRRPSPHPVLAKAAALVTAVALGAVLTASLQPGIAPEGNVTRVVYDTLRGESAAPHVDHPESTSRQVVVDLAVPADAQDVALSFDGGKVTHLSVSAEGFVSAVLPRDTFERSVLTLSYARDGQPVTRILSKPNQSGDQP